ncbi:MAG: MmoB/DmpM family protein [Proteobacteria bacterium]|nr:MmoB/DmpM family protein [Pseudomonadota bacterium]
MTKDNVFLALQVNDETRPLVQAIEQDNPNARVTSMPALLRIDAPGRLIVKRETVEAITGRPWDMQRIHINLISLSGHVDETEEHFAIAWRH